MLSLLTSFPFLLEEISYHWSIGRAGDLSVLVPGIDFLKVELFEIGIVLESLVDCGGFGDTFKSLFSLISSSEVANSLVFCWKSRLLKASFEELLVPLGCNISEMLGESI